MVIANVDVDNNWDNILSVYFGSSLENQKEILSFVVISFHRLVIDCSEMPTFIVGFFVSIKLIYLNIS